MQNSSSQKGRPGNSVRKRDRERLNQLLHIKRIHGTIQIVSDSNQDQKSGDPPSDIPVRVILNDFSPKGVGLFSQTYLPPGLEVVFNLTEPSQLSVKSRIIWCQSAHSKSRVFSSETYSYRLGLEFILSEPKETDQLQQFLDSHCNKRIHFISTY